MGNEQSTQKKRQKTNAGKTVENGEMNGHAFPTPDVPKPVANKEVAVEQRCETPPVTITKEPKPPKKEEVDGSKLNGSAHVETTPEQKTTVTKDAEPPKTAPKTSEDEMTNFFGKMFKKKSQPVKPASKSNDSVDAKVTAVDLKIDVQPTNAGKTVENGEINGHAVPTPDVPKPVANKEAAVVQKCETPPVTITKEPKPPKKEEVDGSKLNRSAHVETTPEQKTTVTKDAEPPKTAPKTSEDEMTNFFGKMFKKKSQPVKPASKSNDSVDAKVTAVDLKIDVQPDPVDIKTSTEPEPEPEVKALEPSPVEVTEGKNPPEEIKAAEKTVMNFFKTFATPTKTSKEAKATPDASKEQSQKETPPAPSTNVQEAPKAPPPPPQAPAKMESKAEPVVKKEETSATKAAATKAEGSAKTKTKDSFSKLFRPKPVVVEEKKAVEVQVDSSKSSTLEAAAKPEEPPAPKPEEKKLEKKSTFGNMFKPKAPQPKKETPAPPPVAEATAPVKAKEEPKPAAPAPQTAPDNKSVGSTDNSSPNMPRKLEKRNSLQLFFKNLVK